MAREAISYCWPNLTCLTTNVTLCTGGLFGGKVGASRTFLIADTVIEVDQSTMGLVHTLCTITIHALKTVLWT